MAQTDSLLVQMELGINGRWQTGNLNQLGLNPNARIALSKSNFHTELNVNYQFLRVEGFTAISDFWGNHLLQIQPNRKFYPVLSTLYGFAKSYKINHSFVIGGGIGTHLFKKSPAFFLQINVVVGYLNMEFEGETAYSKPNLGTMLKGVFPIATKINMVWELQTYHPGFDTDLWGANNRLLLQYPISKSLSISIIHNIIFNNKTVADIKKTNTLMMFGIQYRK